MRRILGNCEIGFVFRSHAPRFRQVVHVQRPPRHAALHHLRRGHAVGLAARARSPPTLRRAVRRRVRAPTPHARAVDARRRRRRRAACGAAAPAASRVSGGENNASSILRVAPTSAGSAGLRRRLPGAARARQDSTPEPAAASGRGGRRRGAGHKLVPPRPSTAPTWTLRAREPAPAALPPRPAELRPGGGGALGFGGRGLGPHSLRSRRLRLGARSSGGRRRRCHALLQRRRRHACRRARPHVGQMRRRGSGDGRCAAVGGAGGIPALSWERAREVIPRLSAEHVTYSGKGDPRDASLTPKQVRTRLHRTRARHARHASRTRPEHVPAFSVVGPGPAPEGPTPLDLDDARLPATAPTPRPFSSPISHPFERPLDPDADRARPSLTPTIHLHPLSSARSTRSCSSPPSTPTTTAPSTSPKPSGRSLTPRMARTSCRRRIRREVQAVPTPPPVRSPQTSRPLLPRQATSCIRTSFCGCRRAAPAVGGTSAVMEGCADAGEARGSSAAASLTGWRTAAARARRRAATRRRRRPARRASSRPLDAHHASFFLPAGSGKVHSQLPARNRTAVIRGGRGFNRFMSSCLLLFIAAAAVAVDLTIRVLHATHVVEEGSSTGARTGPVSDAFGCATHLLRHTPRSILRPAAGTSPLQDIIFGGHHCPAAAAAAADDAGGATAALAAAVPAAAVPAAAVPAAAVAAAPAGRSLNLARVGDLGGGAAGWVGGWLGGGGDDGPAPTRGAARARTPGLRSRTTRRRRRRRFRRRSPSTCRAPS